MQYFAVQCTALHQRGRTMKNTQPLWRENRKEARSRFGGLPPELLRQLKSLSSRFHLEISLGEVQLLDGRWYVTHSGLMSIAQRNKCAGIKSAIVRLPTPRLADGSFKRSSTRHQDRSVSPVLATPTRAMYRVRFWGPSCASQKLVPLTALCGRRTESYPFYVHLGARVLTEPLQQARFVITGGVLTSPSRPKSGRSDRERPAIRIPRLRDIAWNGIAHAPCVFSGHRHLPLTHRGP
jgi:hypothetical protein